MAYEMKSRSAELSSLSIISSTRIYVCLRTSYEYSVYSSLMPCESALKPRSPLDKTQNSILMEKEKRGPLSGLIHLASQKKKPPGSNHSWSGLVPVIESKAHGIGPYSRHWTFPNLSSSNL